MKLLPCVLNALIVQQADAKRKKRGKQYLTVVHNPAPETEVRTRFKNVLVILNISHIKICSDPRK